MRHAVEWLAQSGELSVGVRRVAGRRGAPPRVFSLRTPARETPSEPRDGRMRVAFFDNVRDNEPKSQDVTWDELKQLLTTPTVTSCAPCIGHRCPAKLEQRGWAPVDMGPLRRDDHVRTVTVAVFDLDGVSSEQINAASAKLEGYAAIVHTTHGHRPGANSLRVVVPLSRPVLPSEWKQVREAAERLLALPADPNTKNPSRMYFLPNNSGEHEFVANSSEGRALDVDALLATRPPASPAPPRIAVADLNGPTDVYELRAKLRRVRQPEHAEIIRRALAGEPLAAQGMQDNTLNKLMSSTAFALPLETPEEIVLELFGACFAATDWGEGTEHLREQALLKLRRHRERRRESDAKRFSDNEALWTSLGTKKPAPSVPVNEVAEEDPDAWRKELITIETPTGTRLKNCEANLHTVLTLSPEWRGTIRFNAVTKDLEYSGGPLPEGTPVEGMDGDIAFWFQRSEYGRLGLFPRAAHVREVLRQVAMKNTYDPLRDYLEGLTWDGVPRADTMLEHFFGAQGDVEHLRTISGKWLISAVARALRPGCKVDTVLILEGPQGLKKSSAFRVLAGEWFCDAPINVRDKDSAALAGRNWQIELAEVTTVRAADAEEMKAYVSRNEDTYRPPYGRVTVRAPRRCVLVGTTNSAEYLRADPSGYRRWWPVRCTRIDLEGLKHARDQLWAEAVVRFKEGEEWWLDNEEAQRAEKHAQERSETDGGPDETILQWVLSLPPERRNEVTTELVARDALLLTTPGQIPRGVRLDIGRALRRLGFQRTQRRIAGVQTWVYLPPENIRTAPQQAPGMTRPCPVARLAPGKAATQV
ncbi:virulence-associated E family protein [Myxococcus qinghaiensis]|uniref:virulence-associated E family protein n=1 Tax=Myxococcus qinghaiensis TaxID=2906758 RepID=UPI0020A7E70D|nr:virulence-associated E family protein [Myxococcus qinghaiensis]MCP3163320.1 virulence-associated E family protein [Myxococcus qinghaiensis]